jgi:putative membrane protein
VSAPDSPAGGPPDPVAPVAPVAPPEPRQRLHPLSPLLHGAKSLAVIIAALSWSTLDRVGFGRFSLMAATLLTGALVLSVVSWYNTGYHVVGRELRIHEGLLWRRTRAIPLERLQAVEVVRPVLAQLTGLAELRLEVVGGGQTEAPLAYLTVADATALRDRLLTLAGQTRATSSVTTSATETVVPAPGHTVPAQRHLHTVTNRDVLLSQLLTPQALLMPIGVAFVALQFLDEGSWSFIGVASTLTAMFGILLQPVRRVLDDWNFRLGRDWSALRIRHGLLETRAQTVPLDRIQTISVAWPLLWRITGWLRLGLQIAGYSGPGEEARRADRLLPVGDRRTAEMILNEVLPGVTIPTWLAPPPERARWRHPLTRSVLGAGLGATVFAVRQGLFTREITVVPYARIQSVRVVQGPLQRRLRLATVHADIAAGIGAAARSRDLDEAWALAAELAARARAARARDRATRR